MLISTVKSYAGYLRNSGIKTVTRFAPSPNGSLHLGHAWAAIMAHDFARAAGGTFLLRIEDIDGSRSRTEHIAGILRDMAWLGLTPDRTPIYQSHRIDSYHRALESLKAADLVYPCICSRSDIAQVLHHTSVRHGPDGPHYPQICKGRAIDLSLPHCWRLDMNRALSHVGMHTKTLTWEDIAAGIQAADPASFGDIVLWRKDAPASYHLAATLDDHTDQVTHIVRGMDLFAYSGLHRLLQVLLGLFQPTYWHHPLLLDSAGEKLSKSRNSDSLAVLQAQGLDGHMLANTLRRVEVPLGIYLSNA